MQRARSAWATLTSPLAFGRGGTPRQLPIISMFVDESGTTSDSSFVVAMFCTVEEAAWRTRVQNALDAELYTNKLHFKEISGTNPRHGRFLVSKRIVADMAGTMDWWAHYTYVDRNLVDTSYFGHSGDIEYNKWLADLIRWRTKRSGYRYKVVVAQRDRLRNDNFIPDGLQTELDVRRALDGSPEVLLSTAPGRSDRMLQVADLLVSAVRQRYVPSGNPLKEELAKDVDRLIKWEGQPGNRRIRPFEWMPWSMVREKEKGEML